MRSKKFVVVGDNHGDMADPASVSALMAFLKDFKPEIRVHLGDNYDFRNLRKGASDDEKAASLQEDWAAGTDFMRSFFDGGKQNHLLLGNHDARIYNFAHSATGVLRDYANDGIKQLESEVRKCKAQMLPYDSAHGILKIGKLTMLHGYHAGVGATRQHAAVYGSGLFGHVHTQESSPIPSLEPAEARSIGCLCIRDMDYINAKTGKLRWTQGWAYGLLHEDGSYTLSMTRKINDRFVYASEFKTV